MFKNYSEYKTNRKKIEFIKLPSQTDNFIKCSVAIIIPHRNRIEHLKKFIKHIENMKHIQKDNKLDIFIIDQDNADEFSGFSLKEKQSQLRLDNELKRKSDLLNTKSLHSILITILYEVKKKLFLDYIMIF